jgi:outer membrane protein assembly factor BamB/tetratricopeptide (TPR) repeat protein
VELSGTITATELAEIFQLLTTTRKEGTLTVSDGVRRKSIYFSRSGVTLLFEKDKRARSLGQLLVDYGRVSEEQLHLALERQRDTDKRLGEVVCEMGLVTEADIEELVRTQIEEEIFDLLSWRGGTFQFRDEPLPEQGSDPERSYTSLLFDPNSLLMEAARRMDEWERIGELVRTEREVFHRVEGAPAELEPELGRAVERVLPLIDGVRAAEDILREARLPKFMVYSVLYRLREAGAVALVTPEELNGQALTAIETGDVTRAVALLESAVAQGRGNLEFVKNLGKAYDLSGDREKAGTLYAQVVRGYLAQGQTSEAAAVLTRMRELSPETPRVLALEVSTALAMGDSREAVRKGLSLVHAAEREGQYEEARAVIDQVLAQAPDHAQLREAVADMLARMGDREGAIRQYEEVGRMYISRGRGYYARGVYQRILELNPGHMEARAQVDTLGPQLGRVARTLRLLAAGAALGVVALVGWWWATHRPGPPPAGGANSGSPASGSSGEAGGGASSGGAPAVEAARSRALELENEAQQFTAAGKLSRAVEAYEQAASLTREEQVAARCRQEAERLAKLLEQARAQLARGQELERAGKYDEARREYLTLCANYDFAVAEFGLTLPVPVNSLPEGAQVLIDGAAAGTTPTVLHLPPFKQFTVSLVAANHEPWQQVLTSDTVAAVMQVLGRQASWSQEFTARLVAGAASEADRVFLLGADGVVHALRVEGGGELWQSPQKPGAGGSLVVAGEVVVLAGPGGDVCGLAVTDGTERWRFQAGDAIKGAPTYEGSLGTVFFGALDKNLYGLEARTGTERWRFATGGNVEASPTGCPSAAADGRDRLLVCGSLDGSLYALEAETGRLRWRSDAGGPVATRAVSADGVVCSLNLRGEVIGFTLAGGEERWRYKLPGPSVTALGLAGGVLCLATEPGKLLGLDPARGTVLWQRDLSTRVVAACAADAAASATGAGPKPTGDELWVVGADGALLCLEGKTGEPVWQAQLGPSAEVCLWVGGGRVWVGTARRLWCFPE